MEGYSTMENVLESMSKQESGTIMYLTINDFFSKYLTIVDGDLGKYQIIIVSKDIIADSYTTQGQSRTYKTNFENVDFAQELFPNDRCMEYRYGATMDSFNELYKNQLDGLDQGRTLCSIVDLVINEGVNMYILCSNVEYKIGFMHIMQEVIFNKFGIVMHNFEEYKEDPECLKNIGDVETARLMLQFQIQNMGFLDENIGVFFNQFTKDMAEEYRKILMNKTVDELYVIGTRNDIHVNRHKPKEYIVEHIMQKLIPSIVTELPWA